jgi:hypothetical protein
LSIVPPGGQYLLPPLPPRPVAGVLSPIDDQAAIEPHQEPYGSDTNVGF